MKRFFSILFFVGLLPLYVSGQAGRNKSIWLVTGPHPAARVQYGMEQLSKALQAVGYNVQTTTQRNLPTGASTIVIGTLSDTLTQTAIRRFKFSGNNIPGKEGFVITTGKQHALIAGADNSGTLYGCLEMAGRIRTAGALPTGLNITDQPEMVLRGTCIGIQKTTYLPGRNVYEYPYTPQEFPWFYDKALWIQYLDMLAANRMNSLYLWNGHPFASLVRLKDYPYAVEVDSATFQKNREMYHFLTTEADKRGIWVIQMFYNIILSKPFAEKHGLVTQDRKRPVTPLISDYTRKSIAAFVAEYPNVGLLVTLGEAMSDEDDVKWFTETIIPGVKDGLHALGKTTLPPIVLRGHDTNPQQVMQAALPLYPNLYTENKYNGEALTTYTPRGPWAAMHRDLSRLTVDIDNVHILANLEPFRYGATTFIQKCVQAMHSIHGANGLHLYPQASYWDWPYTADKATPRLLQVDRDWLWYQAWARYAWNCHRNREEENRYWSGLLDTQFGGQESGKNILEAYEQAGEIAPKLLRRFGITNGNRQTLTLGMLMSQLVNPSRWRVWADLYDSDGPAGETLTTYAEKEWLHQSHTGETPVQVITEITQHGDRAVAAIEKAAATVQQNSAEFARIKNDMYCYQALARYFNAKVQAALYVLRYRYSHDNGDLQKALPYLQQSVAHYKELADLTKDTYLYANSMQTQQRKVPVGGDNGKNKTWVELLPYYEAELRHFTQHLDSLKNISPHDSNANGHTIITRLHPAQVNFLHPANGYYQPVAQQRPFTDKDVRIQTADPALSGLQALPFSMQQQQEKGTILQFSNTQPVKAVIGYFDTKEKNYLRPPDLETDASADDHGQAAIRMAHALTIPSLPPVNLHTYYFDAGKHTLILGKGACLVLGFMDGKQEISAGVAADSVQRLDWLFEE
ncbi:hypothetical protein AB6805_28860 [Chitinophaga sp. RCC_12]|uniref:alpha-d-galacturonidase n=1 Tax=Chitinophaga sp. RCC_12 TaxID=3239226 RepID=UPI0035267B39